MTNSKRTIALTAMLALAGAMAPASSAHTFVAGTAATQDQSQKDREFANKLRELKDRQHEEWQNLIRAQNTDLKKEGADPVSLSKRHEKEKKAMKRRHAEELQTLKDQYKG